MWCTVNVVMTLSLKRVSSLSSGLVIAMLVSLLFIVLLRFLAGIMVWIMIVLVILVIGYGESLRCYNFSKLKF